MAELCHAISTGETGTVLKVTGEIDISNARALRSLLLDTLDRSTALVVDLAAVASMDSSGIATLIDARSRARESGKSFHVAAVSERVGLALRLLCIEQMLMDPPGASGVIGADRA